MVRHVLETEFWFGDIVYLKVNEDPDQGMVTELSIYPGNVVFYKVSFTGGHEYRQECELTKEFVPRYPKNSDSEQESSE